MSIRKHGKDCWPRLVAYGRFVNNVLLVNSSLALVRKTVHAVDRLDPFELGGPASKLDSPCGWTIRLDDGGTYDIGLSRADAARLA